MYQKIIGQKLYEKVVEQIMDMIAHGEYKKGDMLPSEKELIDRTGVSRITVREALKILSDAGVIETRKGKGSFVLIDYDVNERFRYDKTYCENFLAATQVRLWLEPDVARYVALNATDEDIKLLEETLKDKKLEGDALEKFHYTIALSTKNSMLIEVFNSIVNMEKPPEVVNLVAPAEQKKTAHKLQLQHNLIFDAIKRHDGEFAYFYMKEHVLFVYEQYRTYFSSFL